MWLSKIWHHNYFKNHQPRTWFFNLVARILKAFDIWLKVASKYYWIDCTIDFPNGFVYFWLSKNWVFRKGYIKY